MLMALDIHKIQNRYNIRTSAYYTLMDTYNNIIIALTTIKHLLVYQISCQLNSNKIIVKLTTFL